MGQPSEEHRGPVIRDKRRIDPETGQPRTPHGGAAEATTEEQPTAQPQPETVDGAATQLTPDSELAAERLRDLQRLQAEYVNYRRRVERDRDVARETAVSGVLEQLLPVLDDVHLARQHGDLEGTPFAAIADKLEAVLGRFGLSRFGEAGEAFDPAVHEALMHTEADLPEGTEVTTVVQVLQPGYRAGERVLRAARVAVADPR
jgi:molecular chaperone GrpE